MNSNRLTLLRHCGKPWAQGDTSQPQQQKSDTSLLHPGPNHPQSSNTGSFSATFPLQQNNVCLLKTAIATVVHGSGNAEAKSLLDKGSQQSFVTQDLAMSLALRPSSRERINISSFSATCPTSRMLDVAKTNLLTRHGEAVKLSVLIVPFIATTL